MTSADASLKLGEIAEQMTAVCAAMTALALALGQADIFDDAGKATVNNVTLSVGQYL